jgi:hypothetical protein
LAKQYLVIGDDVSCVRLRIQNIYHLIGHWLGRGYGPLKLCGFGATVGALGVFRIPRGDAPRMKGMAARGLRRASGLLTRRRGMIHNLFIAYGAINGFGHVIPNMMKNRVQFSDVAFDYL